MGRLSVRLIIIGLVVWICGTLSVQGSETLRLGDFNFHFKHYTHYDGLPQNSVNDIERDDQGFVWFATGNGLSRFDGYSFKNFTKPALPSNLVNALAQSPDGRLWAGTKQGLCYVDLATEQIVRFPQVNQGGNEIAVVSLFCDAKGNIWVGTNESGVFLLKPVDDGYHVTHYSSDNSALTGNLVHVVAQLADGTLMVGTNHGISVFDYGKGAFSPWNGLALNNSLVLSVLEARSGEIWVGTNSGVFVVNRAANTSRWYFSDPYNRQSISHGRVNDIVEDKLGNIYLASLGGLDIYKPQSDSFYRVPQGQNEMFSLNSKFVNCLLADLQGNIWVGTEKGGVNQINIYQKPFYNMVNKVDDVNSLSSNTINSVLVDGDDFWIGTAGGGLNLFDSQTNKIIHFRYNPSDPSSIASDFVTSLIKLPNGQLWLGTWGGGLCKMGTNGTFKRYVVPVNSPENNNQNAFVSSMVYAEPGYLFVGTEGGLAVWDLRDESFVKMDASANGLSKISEIGCLYNDSKGFIWAGTRNGLYRFSARAFCSPNNVAGADNRIRFFNSAGNVDGKLPGDYVISLLEGKDGTMWVGTYGDGLLKCQWDGKEQFAFSQYTSSQGLCNNVVYAIRPDDSGNLWLSTDNGLACFNPTSRTFYNYFSQDGLVGDQFYWSASYKSNSGHLFFGSVNGLTFFSPGSFPKYDFKPQVKFTAIRVFNQPVAVGDERHGKTVLPKALALTDKVSLSYLDNVFAIEFSALDYFHPQKIKYAYKLDGVDNDWVEVGANQRTAAYTNLKGGTYVFRVKCTNSDGIWSDRESKLVLEVRPPFWQTNWFRLLMVVFVVLIALVYSRYYSRRLIVQKSKLEGMVHLRTQKIEEQSEKLKHQADELIEANHALEHRQELIEGQKKELEAKNEEISKQRDHVVALNAEIEESNQLRLRFFTNISHEFRTPLTLIVAPIEKLVKEADLAVPVREALNVVHRNARRLNLLIDQLLTFRRIETGNLRLVITNGNVSGFIADIFHAFDGLAAQRQVNYVYRNSFDAEFCWFDREKLENILYNLLSNAFKYTPEKGTVSLTVTMGEIDSDGARWPALQLEIKDTGVGIPQEFQERIFDRFYRVPSHSNVNGTGIGLSLTAELVGAMKGCISVDSMLGAGSCFTVVLPIDPEHLGDAEVLDMHGDDRSDLDGKVKVIEDAFRDDEHFLADQKITGATDKPTLLIVEDNKDLLTFLSEAFVGSYSVLLAENGKKGYEMARKFMPEIVLSDVMMPEMDGVEMCKQIKCNLYTSHIPVVLLTARALVESQLEGLSNGADDYIPKPFNLEIVKAKVSNLIESREKLRAKFCAQTEVQPVDSATSSLDEKFLTKAYEMLEANYANSDFTVEMFSELMYVSRSLLYKKLKALVDLSPNDFITVYRLKKSVGLLGSKELSVNEVAYAIGFNDPKYFSRVFKKFYKKTPSEFSLG